MALFITGCGGGTSTRSTPAPSTNSEAPSPPPRKASPVQREPTQGVTDSGPVIGVTQPAPEPTPTPPPVKPRVESTPPPTPEPRRTPRPPVRQTRPAPSQSGDDPFGVLLGKRPQITAQESSSGSSIRGLSPLAKDYATRSRYPQDAVNAVKQMEQFQVDRKTLYRFQREGGLRPR